MPFGVLMLLYPRGTAGAAGCCGREQGYRVTLDANKRFLFVTWHGSSLFCCCLPSHARCLRLSLPVSTSCPTLLPPVLFCSFLLPLRCLPSAGYGVRVCDCVFVVHVVWCVWQGPSQSAADTAGASHCCPGTSLCIPGNCTPAHTTCSH